jgi:arginase
MPKPWTILEAPSSLGLHESGVRGLPHALLAAGLGRLPDLRSSMRVEPLPDDHRLDHETGILNTMAIAEYTRRLADGVGALLDRQERPLVLGGDCTILLGNLLALARRGRHGLLFLDGHADFYQPDANVNGEAASSELAFATGRGPAMLTRFDDNYPLIRDEDIVAIGIRDAAEAAAYGSQPLPASLRSYDLSTLRRIGVEQVMEQALEHLRRVDGIWIHFDADVLDDAVMPAVDYRLPDGLTWGEAETALTIALARGSVIGMDVTIFNPSLDPDGSIARVFVDLLTRVLRQRPGSTM